LLRRTSKIIAPSARIGRAVLQRKCACGQHTGGGECDECKKKKMSLQRHATSLAAPAIAPPIVHDVLRSPGHPLDSETLADMEPRFEHDFSNVQIHTGEQAAASAGAVNAMAYTVGNSIVFGRDQYAPRTVTGRQLLLHELTHVAQQDHSAPPGEHLPVGPFDSPLETEAHRMASLGASYGPVPARPRQQSSHVPDVFSLRAASTVAQRAATSVLQKDGPQKDPDTPVDRTTLTTLPGYSQKGDTCGAASLVTALIIWDRDRRDPKAPSTAVESACNSILTNLAQYRKRTIDGWNAKGMKGEDLYNTAVATTTGIRDSARVPGGTISEMEYQLMGRVLYLLYVDAGAGLSAAEISAIQRSLGLESGHTEGVQSFAEIFNSSILRGLRPGQIAQIGWYVKTGKPDAQGLVNVTHHAFLIGRRQDGTWFLSDQGPTPAVEMTAADLGMLQSLMTTASRTGSYWMFTGSLSDFKMLVVGGWTGVRLLTDRATVESKAASIVTPGTFLAEVDAGALTIGDKLTAGDFVSRHYSLAEAKSVDTASFGGLIVEMPQGVFSYYRTNLITHDDNLKVTGIDQDDSKGGLLDHREFFHAWLRLCTKDTCRASLLQVY
jgi:hypothetical protein